MTLMGAIKQLHELRSAEDMPFYYKPAIAEVINVLLMDAREIKRGHWITWFENEDVRQAKCSECGMMFTLGKGRDIHYCGNCGAYMGEEDDKG